MDPLLNIMTITFSVNLREDNVNARLGECFQFYEISNKFVQTFRGYMYGTYFKNTLCSRYGGRACDECEAGKFGFPNCKGKIFTILNIS